MFNKDYTKIVSISGMKCENCRKHVSSALSSIPGAHVKVSLKNNNAIIKSSKEIDNNLIKEKVSSAGYSVTSID